MLYSMALAETSINFQANGKRSACLVTDPVCEMEFPADSAAASMKFNGQTYYFCHVVCLRLFAADPLLYLSPVDQEDEDSLSSETG